MNAEVVNKFKKRPCLPRPTALQKACTACLRSCLVILDLKLETYVDLQDGHFSLFFFPPALLNKPLKPHYVKKQQ